MYASEMIVSPLAITSTRITPSVSQKTVTMTFPAEGVVLNFFFLGDCGWCQSTGPKRFSSFWATEGCTAWDKVWRRRECDSSSEDMAMWTGNELVQGKHACPCFALALGHRRRWRLCGKITCVKETSSYTVHKFHTFWINSFWEKKWGALLSEQSSYYLNKVHFMSSSECVTPLILRILLILENNGWLATEKVYWNRRILVD